MPRFYDWNGWRGGDGGDGGGGGGSFAFAFALAVAPGAVSVGLSVRTQVHSACMNLQQGLDILYLVCAVLTCANVLPESMPDVATAFLSNAAFFTPIRSSQVMLGCS